MLRTEWNKRIKSFQSLSFGNLHWCSYAMQEVAELERESELTRQNFSDQLQALINQALKHGIASEEFKTMISQNTKGETHVDS